MSYLWRKFGRRTIDDLVDKMTTLAAGEEVYGKKSLREKLKEHYGNHLFFARTGEERKTCYASRTWLIILFTKHGMLINVLIYRAIFLFFFKNIIFY